MASSQLLNVGYWCTFPELKNLPKTLELVTLELTKTPV